MIRRTDSFTELSEVRGGTGIMEKHEILTSDEMYGSNKLFGKMVLRKGASIGLHQHVNESEAYYILSGTGLFTEDDNTPQSCGPGDICFIEEGHSHALANTGDGPLEFIALVYPAK